MHLATLNAAATNPLLSLCADAARPSPAGANYVLAASPLQASLLWPSLSHSPDFNADDTRVYLGDQAGGEGGASGIPGQAAGGDTCQPYPRPFSLSWAFEAFISEVTDPADAHRVSMVEVAINKPEFCTARQASGRDPSVSFHMVDDPLNAKFAAVSFGTAGLRVYDIRKRQKPVEMAYFNHGPLVHVGVSYYDGSRGLLYVPAAVGFRVLQLEPQVRVFLGLP